MPAERLPAEILQFVQPGRVIDPASGAKIYDFVTESGQNMGKVVEETVTGNNGILYTIRNFITTTGAAAGTYLTTGLAAAPVELSVASGAWMAALGISGGALLYQSMPDLFNKISDAIFGDFVDGLPVLYFDRYGRLQIAEDTVNKVKNTLIENNAYKNGVITYPLTTARKVALNNARTQMFSLELELQDLTPCDDVLGFIYNIAKENSLMTAARSDFMDQFENNHRYIQLCRDFISKYDSDTYFYQFSTESSWTGYYSGWKLQAIPKKLYSLMKNQESIPCYATWTDTNDVTHEYEVKVIKLILGTYYEYDNTGSLSSMGCKLSDTNLNQIMRYRSLKPLNRDDMPDVKYVTSSTYYGTTEQWADNYYITKRTSRSVVIAGETKTEYNTEALDTELVTWTFYPTTYTKVTDFEKNIYVGNISPTDRSFIYNDGTYDYYIVFPEYNNQYYNIYPDWLYWGNYNGTHYEYCPATDIMIEDEIDNRWITPGATYPIADEDVTTTYPTWPAEVAEGIGKLLTVTPQDLNPSADQEVAQSPGLDIDPINWNEFFRNLLSEVSPDPEPAPDPSPSPEPIPQPDPDPAPAPVPVPDPDPANPNTPVTPDPNPVIPPNLNTVSSSRLFTVYWPTANELDLLGATLWSSNFITQMEKVWNDPMQGVISLKKVYALPQSTRSEFIILGNFDTTIMSRIVENQFVYTDCGTLQVPEVMHNATDFTPYTQIAIYLPFIGIQELDADDIVGGRLHLIYRFDLYTGVCLAEIYVLRSDMTPEKMLYCFTGNAAQEIPLTGSNAQGFFNTLMTIGGGAIVAASGGALTGAVGVAAVGHSMSHEMTHVGRSGNLSANAGIMGNRYPQIIISNRNRYDANGYNNIYGYPANKSVYLGNCKGFTKVKAINLRTFATQPEKDEIERLLKEGVIF